MSNLSLIPPIHFVFIIWLVLKFRSGDNRHGNWYIPELFYCKALDKLFKFEDNMFIEFTGPLNPGMIKSYEGQYDHNNNLKKLIYLSIVNNFR